MDSYMRKLRDTFPKVVPYHGLNVPVKVEERFIAFDANQKLWAYKLRPAFSEASQKWIPQDEDTPRLILQLNGGQVNSKLSIACV